jgi:hypothetical protein
LRILKFLRIETLSFGTSRFIRRPAMTDRAFEPKQGRIRDSGVRTNLTTARRVLTQAGRAGAGIVRQRGHIARDARWRGTAPGLFARAGIMAPGSRRVIVRARYSRQVAGDLGAAKAHLRYIQRDGITRDGGPGQLYDATSDQADGNAFLDRRTAAASRTSSPSSAT